MLTWLFGNTKTPAPVVHHVGDGRHEHDVVGESFYMDALRQIMADAEEDCSDWLRLETVAHMVPVSYNRHDANAVEIRISGKHVGHLSRDNAKAYRAKHGNVSMTINALIVGKDDTFGVKLDIL